MWAFSFRVCLDKQDTRAWLRIRKASFITKISSVSRASLEINDIVWSDIDMAVSSKHSMDTKLSKLLSRKRACRFLAPSHILHIAQQVWQTWKRPRKSIGGSRKLLSAPICDFSDYKCTTKKKEATFARPKIRRKSESAESEKPKVWVLILLRKT